MNKKPAALKTASTSRKTPARKAASKAIAKVTGKPAATPLGRRPHQADGQGDTRAAILRAATAEFARSGYDGARIDRISKAARANDRMIYYYFGSKEKLFIEVLEAVYTELGEAESALDLDLEQPLEALEAVVRFTLEYYRHHLEMISLLNNENLRAGSHVAKSRKVKTLSSPLTSLLDRILQSGARQGLFRRDMRSQDLYIAIAALHYFYVSNRYTLSRFLDTDLMGSAALAHWSDFAVDVVLRSVRADGAAPLKASPKNAPPPGKTSKKATKKAPSRRSK